MGGVSPAQEKGETREVKAASFSKEQIWDGKEVATCHHPTSQQQTDGRLHCCFNSLELACDKMRVPSLPWVGNGS